MALAFLKSEAAGDKFDIIGIIAMSLNSWHAPYVSYGFAPRPGAAVRKLIIVNVGLFVLVLLFRGLPWFSWLALVPKDVFGRFRIWQLVSYLFLHAGVWHLAVNMLMLWFFGPAIESAWGSGEFLRYYFCTGVGAGICSWLTAAGSSSPVVGASGAIFGLLVAYALMFPDTVILLFFIFPMKIRHAVLFLAAANLLGALSAPHAGIAYFAHLGGGLCGYLYLKSEWLKRKLSYWTPADFSRRLRDKTQLYRKKQALNLDRQVDNILEKVSKFGLGSLSKQERRILKRKSKGIKK